MTTTQGMVAAALLLASSVATAAARVHKVPSQHATLQEAVDAAGPGDLILVAPGEYCGATVDKRLTFVGLGHPRIVGCAEGPALAAGQRIGFLLPGAGGESDATGTQIHGFVFDGRGVSSDNLEPLALGVLARFASDVWLIGNTFLGTTQAITSSAGDRWLIVGNRVDGLTLFDCTGICAGGDGIVIQIARAGLEVEGGAENPVNRPEHNHIIANRISGAIPDGFDVFSMAAILVLAADDTHVVANRVAIPDNPTADAAGIGVLVSNSCCGLPQRFIPGSRDTRVVANDGRESEFVLVVEGQGGENLEGFRAFANRGAVRIEEDAALRVAREAQLGEGDIAF